MLLVGSTKVRVPKEDQRKDEKPIRLNDLIPSREVTGGRRTVFGGSRVATPPNKRKSLRDDGLRTKAKDPGGKEAGRAILHSGVLHPAFG